MKAAEKQALGATEAGGADAARWLRARRPEHKQERRDAILAAALRLLDAGGVEGSSLSAIAREAGLSKANCYRYFESREAILLAVILDEARAWARDVDTRLEALPGRSDADAVAEVFVRTTVERPRLCVLVSSLWSVLERNVGVDAIANFKRSFLEVTYASVASVERALPSLSDEDAHAYVTYFFLFVAGAWPAANPAPIVVEVLGREEFAGHSMEFEPVLRAHAQTVLRGLLAERD